MIDIVAVCFLRRLFVLVLLLLATSGPAVAQFGSVDFPGNLEPGLYYYFALGSQTASIHYVPYPTALAQDPYSKPVKPLPVRELQNFPELTFKELKTVTRADLERRAHQPSQISGPGASYRDYSYPAPQQTMPPAGAYYAPQPARPGAYAYGGVPQITPTPEQHERMLDEIAGGMGQSNPFQEQGAMWQPPRQAYPVQQMMQPAAPQQSVPSYLPPPSHQPGYAVPPRQQAYPGQWNAQSGFGQAAPVQSAGPVQFGSPPGQPPPQVVSYLPPSGPPQTSPQPSAFRQPPAGSQSTLTGRNLRGVPIEQMNQAARLAKKAKKLFMKEKLEDACEVLEDAAMLDPTPNSGGIHFNLGVVHGRLGHSKRALSEFNRALSFDPGMTNCYRAIGTCYQTMGKVREAKMWFEKYLQTNPNAPDAGEIGSLIKAMEKAEKTLPTDDPEGSDYLASVTVNGLFRWPEEKLPIKVMITDGRGVRFFKSRYKQMMADAFDAWSRASGSRVSWARVEVEGQADIVVKWVEDHSSLSSASGAEGGQTVTRGKRFGTGGGTVVGATIYILTRGLQGEKVPPDEIERICLHEVGHALGLKGHSSNNQDIMFFSEGGSRASILTSRDMATIARLYEGYASRP